MSLASPDVTAIPARSWSWMVLSPEGRALSDDLTRCTIATLRRSLLRGLPIFLLFGYVAFHSRTASNVYHYWDMVEAAGHRDQALFAFQQGLKLFSWVSATVWFAMIWNRHLLRGETMRYLPRAKGTPHWACVGTALRILAPLALAAAVLALLGWGGRAALSVPPIAVVLVLGVTLLYLALRLSLAFSAVAVGAPIPLSDSWRITRPVAGVLLQVSVLLALAVYCLHAQNLRLDWLSETHLFFGALALVSAIILTLTSVLYAHLVEGRALDGALARRG